MLYVPVPYEVHAIAKKESALTGKSVRQIIAEKLRGNVTEQALPLDLVNNLRKLDEIRTLPRNWNGNGAKRFSRKIINRAKNLLLNLDRQPQVFPTANDSIQIEYDGDENSYLEFQVTKKRTLHFYKVDKIGVEKMGIIPCSPYAVNALLEKFYE